jgi:hypothetical protein
VSEFCRRVLLWNRVRTWSSPSVTPITKHQLTPLASAFVQRHSDVTDGRSTQI